MPTYEYQCKKCGCMFEKFQSMKDAPLKRCPTCRGTVQRLIGSGGGVIFKGSGFYETDYKRKSKGKVEDKSASCSKPDCPSAKTDSSGKK